MWGLGRLSGRNPGPELGAGPYVRPERLAAFAATWGFWKSRIPRARILAIGADGRYRHWGVTALLLKSFLDHAPTVYREFELSWIAEDNVRSLRLLRHFLRELPYKTYRLYDRPIPTMPPDPAAC